MLHQPLKSGNIPEEVKSIKYPAEWTQHIATILGFPSKCSLPSKFYEAACGEIIDLAGAISHFEPVHLYTRPEDVTRAQSMLSSTTCGSYAVDIVPFATNHLWVRDTGPVYVHGISASSERQRASISFGFNEWGGKGVAEGWPEMPTDRFEENHSFAMRVVKSENDTSVINIASTVCLEGGALVGDGEGTLIVSESSILGDGRNPELSKNEIEDQLKQLLGVEKVIWFPGFKDLDITDVHADAEVQFVRPGVVAVSKPHESAQKEWHNVYRQVTGILHAERDAKGRPFEIHIIDEPDPKLILPLASDNQYSEDPATNYVNFYYVNGGLILPMFGDETADKAALETIQYLHPERVIMQVYVNALPLTGGVIHCATQPVI